MTDATWSEYRDARREALQVLASRAERVLFLSPRPLRAAEIVDRLREPGLNARTLAAAMRAHPDIAVARAANGHGTLWAHRTLLPVLRAAA